MNKNSKTTKTGSSTQSATTEAPTVIRRMTLDKATISALIWPKTATHLRVTTADGRSSNASRKEAPTSLAGVEGEWDFGYLLKNGDKKSGEVFQVVADVPLPVAIIAGLAARSAASAPADAKIEPAAAVEPAKAPKAPKAAKAPKAPTAAKAAKADDDAETGDRLPGTLEELRAAKGGLVTFLFLTGVDKEQIAKELKAAFKLADEQAAKIVRRITGRVRLFQRALDLIKATK